MSMKNLYFILAIFLLIPGVSIAQISDGLILDLELNGDAIDASGNENNGALNNATFVEDRYGNPEASLYFDGTTSIILPKNISLKPNLPITLSLFVKADNFDETRPIYHSDVLNNDYAGFFVNLTNDGRIMAHIGGNQGNNGPNNQRSFLSNKSISAGIWQNVIITINSYDDIHIYIDCIESEGIYSGSGSQEIVYSEANGAIGEGGQTTNFPQGHFFEGTLDEIKLWNRELTSEELEQICLGRFSRVERINRNVTKVYPNPATESLYIEIEASLQKNNTRYYITDFLGRTIKSDLTNFIKTE